jgi:hypothetical protein
MADYDEMLIAGDEAYFLSRMLYDLSRVVDIPPPLFQGKRLYQEHGTEVWMIKTFISGSVVDPDDPDMMYTEVYPDWPNSVEIAIQGAIARICHKFHQVIPPTSPYYNFGEHTEDGTPVDRSAEEDQTGCRAYLTEREFLSSSIEKLLRKQIAIMDEAREVLKQCNVRVTQAEAALLFVDDKRKAMER